MALFLENLLFRTPVSHVDTTPTVGVKVNRRVMGKEFLDCEEEGRENARRTRRTAKAIKNTVLTSSKRHKSKKRHKSAN